MTTPEIDYLVRCPPPWSVFPTMSPEDLPRHLTQGVAESYFDHVWRPFWASLTAEQKTRYLVHWNATEQWREALGVFDPDPTLDIVADAAESQEYLERWRRAQTQARPTSFWKRLLGRR